MNTKRLQAFLAVVRCGSFAAASERLHMTQSAISLRIRELEQELGTILFDRSGRRAVLTPQGRELIGHAEAITAAVDEMKRAVGGNRTVSGTVRVGVAELIAVTWLPGLIGILREQFPNLTVELQIGITHEIIDRVRRDLLDLALVPGSSFDSELESLSLGQVDFQWMGSPQLVGGGKSWTWEDAPPILLLSRDSYINQTADAWFRRRQIVPARVNTCNSMNALATLAINSLGVALLPTFYYADQLRDGLLEVIESEPPITASFFAVYRSQGIASTSRLVASMAQDVSDFPIISSPATTPGVHLDPAIAAVAGRSTWPRSISRNAS